MLQFFFRRSHENTHRCLPVLKKCWRNIETGSLEDLELPFQLDTIKRYRQPRTYKKCFVENLFLGLFDPEVFEYPQIRTKVEVDHLKEHGMQAGCLALREMEDGKIESAGKFSKATISRLQEIELIGMKIKLEDEGLGYFESESSYIQEFLSLNSSLGKAFAENESSGYQIIHLFGTDSQKLEYLPKFLKGECVASLAHLEDEPWISNDILPINTIAVEEEDDSFIISGRKRLVYNPNCSDIFIVSARIDNSKDSNSYTLFIVDKNSKGLSVFDHFEKFSLKDTEMCDIVLDNVIVSRDRVIGKINEGGEIINKIISKGKLSNGPLCIGIMRKLVNDALNHCIYSNHFNKPLHKFKYIQGKIGEMINVLYSAESMTYLLNGRLDEDSSLDGKLDSLIIKIFNSEALNFILYNYMHLVGKDKCNEKYIETLIMDAPFFNAFDDPNAYLKLILATTGVKHTLNQMSNKTIQEYNPMNQFKLEFLKRRFRMKVNKELRGYLHLTLEEESQIVGYCVQMLNFLTELLISTYGNDILTKPHYLSHLAELAILIYKTAAVLGRSSRAYCIGIRHCENDIRITRNVAQNAYQRTSTIHNIVMKTLKNESIYKSASDYSSACGKFSHLHLTEPVKGKMTVKKTGI